MSWFDEQIRQRIEQDDELLDEAFVTMASAVIGGRMSARLKDSHTVAKDAIGEVLKFYHIKPVEIPDGIRDFDDQLEYMLRPHGIMHRRVKLTKGWYRDAFGPMLAHTTEGNLVTLLPSGLTGYVFVDHVTGNRIGIRQSNAHLIEDEAMCFYRSFPLKKLNILQLVRYIWGTLDLRDYMLMGLSVLLVTLLGMVNPILVHSLTGVVLRSKSVKLLGVVTVFMLTTSVSTAIFSAIRTLITRRIESKLDLGVTSATMMRVLAMPASFFRKYSSGNLSERLDSMNALCNLLVETFLSTGLMSLSSLLYITQIFAFTPGLVVPAMCLIGAEVVFALVTGILQRKVTDLELQAQADESGMSYSILSGLRKIRLTGSEKRAFARWADIYAKKIKYEYDPPMFLKMNTVISQMLSMVGTIVIYYMAVVSNVSAADYYAFESAYATVMSAFTSLAGMALSVAAVRPVLHMVEPILAQPPEISEQKEVISRLSGAIELERVAFSYGESLPAVLKDFTLKIRAGEYVAIVGKTGCGKSTLMRLLLGFETPQRGAIYYDRKNLDSLDLKSLRRKIGSVMQTAGVFAGSIYENIAISAPGITLDEAWEAAETAGLADDIREMPMGMHTMLSEDGGGISGGQKQRLMIARAVAPKPKILLFDEATSALDNVTQRHVSDALDELNCTRIVVAHRLSTIKNCDRIIVMGEGGIVEEGTYDELIEKQGEFWQLVERQQM